MAQTLNRIAAVSVGLGAAGTLLQSVLYVVDGGHRALIWDRFRGVMDDVYDEGMHVRIPFIQKPIHYEVRTRPRVIKSTTGTKDLQTVNLTLRVLFRPLPGKIPQIHKTLGPDYEERVLPSIGNEVLKAVVAQFNADQLLTQRELVSRQVRENLTRRAKEFNIVLDDVALVDLMFAKEFAAAVEAKQVAEQDAERSKFVVMKAEQERKVNVIRAQGEATAAKLINEAIAGSGPGLVEIRKLEAAKEVAETLARTRNVTYLPKSGNLLLNIPNQ